LRTGEPDAPKFSFGKDEKPEDKDKLDKEFKEKQKKLEEKLTQEKNFENWIYMVSTWTVDPLLKERGQLMTEKKEEPGKDETKAPKTTQSTNEVPPFANVNGESGKSESTPPPPPPSESKP